MDVGNGLLGPPPVGARSAIVRGRPERAQTAELVARVRLAGVVLGVCLAFLTRNPSPIAGPFGILAGAALMLAYDIPALVLLRRRPTLTERVILVTLLGDMLVCTLWVLLTSDDAHSTGYVMFALVAVEAATFHRRTGTALFLVGFGVAYAGGAVLRVVVYGFPIDPGSLVFRTGIIALLAVFIDGIVGQSERRRDELVVAAARDADLSRVLGAQADRYASLLNAMSDVGEGLVVTEGGKLVYCNDAYMAMTGYTDVELRQLPSLVALAPADRQAELGARLHARLAGGEAPLSYESQLVRKGGAVVDVETAVRLVSDEGVTRVIAVVRDVTERKRAQAALEDSERRAHAAARRDPLTEVANRRSWDEEMTAAMRAARDAQTPLSVVLLDLDHFKEYNDDWGHQRGDDLLRAIATSWQEALRTDDLLARYGGDEFALMLRGSDADAAAAVVERLRATSLVQQAFSAGVACWDGLEAADQLMARADTALYQAKRAGFAVGPASNAAVTGWAMQIPGLLAGGAIAAAYQPIARLDGQGVIGVEALARPLGTAAMGSVEDLFAAAKRLGFTRDLDWACRKAAVRGAAALSPGLLLFVNVSIHALLDPLHDVDQMVLLLRWAGLSARQVVLEISERDHVTDPRRLGAVLRAYRDEGFRFALDDIGEGHSTLEVLATANPEFVKVARSLSVTAVDPGPQAVVRSLVAFCESSGAELIAEGLETDLHVQLMRRLGVRLGQGYALGAPALPDRSPRSDEGRFASGT